MQILPPCWEGAAHAGLPLPPPLQRCISSPSAWALFACPRLHLDVTLLLCVTPGAPSTAKTALRFLTHISHTDLLHSPWHSTAAGHRNPQNLIPPLGGHTLQAPLGGPHLHVPLPGLFPFTTLQKGNLCGLATSSSILDFSASWAGHKGCPKAAPEPWQVLLCGTKPQSWGSTSAPLCLARTPCGSAVPPWHLCHPWQGHCATQPGCCPFKTSIPESE